MYWPVGFFVFSQLPDHSHNGLIWSLYQPICFWVVQCGPQFLHTEELTHLINDAAHEVITPITQESGWGSEDQDVTLIQELGDCFSCLTGGHICHNALHEMVLEYQDIDDFRQSIEVQGCLYASNVYTQEVHRSGGHNQVQRCFG